jgi:hypothetical protein
MKLAVRLSLIAVGGRRHDVRRTPLQTKARSCEMVDVYPATLAHMESDFHKNCHELHLRVSIGYTRSTALRCIPSLTSMYACVVEMFRCPASDIRTRTPTPLFARFVMNERRPEWLLAP